MPGNSPSEVVGAFKTLFNVRRQRLGFSVIGRAPEVYVDAFRSSNRFSSIFLNNAVKFTPEGGEVELCVERAGLEVLPDDSRILPWEELGDSGLRPVHRPGHGDRDDRARRSLTSSRDTTATEPAGSGAGSHLGMSISKKLAEVQNGFLVIESELGVGTRVSVSVPADEDDVHASQPDAFHRPRASRGCSR